MSPDTRARHRQRHRHLYVNEARERPIQGLQPPPLPNWPGMVRIPPGLGRADTCVSP